MKTVHFVQTKMGNDFCVADADATTGHFMLALPIILNHIKFISFSVNHGTLVQHYVS